MANNKGQRPKSQLSFQRQIPSISAPAISTSTLTPFIATPQGPPSVSSRSSSQTSSMFPSIITTKMRTLWTTSHTEVLNKFNLNFKKLTATNPSLSFNHPAPPSSSPNGLPENSSYTCSSDPLSAPTTRHAEYLFSRVNEGLLTSDSYTTPLPSSLSSPLSESLPSSSFSSGFSLEYMRGKSMIMHNTDTDTDTDTNTETSTEISKPPTYVWKTLQKSCKEVLDNINTHINVPTYTNPNTNLNISKCDERITGQENGNRPLMHSGLEDGDAYSYDAHTLRRYECGANRVTDGDRDRLIRTRSQESIVEISFDVDSSSPLALPTSTLNPTSTSPHNQYQNRRRQQKQYNSNKDSTHRVGFPTLISRPLDPLSDVQGYTPSSTSKSRSKTTPSNEDERTRRARISKEVEDVVNVCFHGVRDARRGEGANAYEGVNRLAEVNREMCGEVLVRDFAYMEMRLKVRVHVESSDEFVSGGVRVVDQRKEEKEKEERGGGDDDFGSQYARSELGFEESRYGGEDEYENGSGGEDMGYGTEKSVFTRLEKKDMDTNSNASITTTTDQPQSNSNSPQLSSSIPYPRPLPHLHTNRQSHPSPTTPTTPTSQALIHIPRPQTPTLNPSTSCISFSFSLTSSIMDSTYLRSNEIQDHLLGYSTGLLGESFPSPDDTVFASGHERQEDIHRVEWGTEVGIDMGEREDSGGTLNCRKYNTEGTGKEKEKEKRKPQGSQIEKEDEDEDENTEAKEPSIQFQLSPYTFPGTNMYLYEPISTSTRTSKPLIAKLQANAEFAAASEPQSQSTRSNTKKDTIAPNNNNTQYDSRIENPPKYPSDYSSQEVKKYEGDVYSGKDKVRRGIMMHFSRSPTGLEGVNGLSWLKS